MGHGLTPVSYPAVARSRQDGDCTVLVEQCVQYIYIVPVAQNYVGLANPFHLLSH